MTASWEQIKDHLRSTLPKNSFSLWIDPITCLESNGPALVLGCPNKFSRNWVMENYLHLMQDIVHKVNAGPKEIHFTVQPQNPALEPAPGATENPQLTLPHMTPHPRLGFNQHFTFDRFIVGRSNEFAYSASRALAEGARWNYHTLLMLANTGLGKTHLSHAVANAILKQRPSARINYVTAEEFTNEMVRSLKSNTIEEFKNKYRRGCDVLLLEEVQFLSGKHKTQSELGYTLDALTNGDKKIIFTSSLPPKDLPNLSKELSSRLTSGLVATIDRPNFETRVKILTQKASHRNMRLKDDVIQFLASRITRDVRQLESSLNYLKAKSELLNAKPDVHLARDVISCLVSDESAVTTHDIMELVCTYYKVDGAMLQSRSRKKVYAYPRNIYSYLCRRYTDEPVQTIGKTINRSHSTVLYASELVEFKMKTDRQLNHQVNFLARRIEQMKR